MQRIYIAFLVCLTILMAQSCLDDPIEIIEYARVQGFVTDFSTDEAMGDVTVSSTPSTNIVTTAPDGFFAIDSIPVGNYSFRFRREGYRDELVAVNIESERTVSLEVQIVRDIEQNEPPSIPVAIAPSLGSEEEETSLVLKWSSTDQDTEDTLRYDLWLYPDGEIGGTLLLENSLQDSFELDDLDYNRSYAWQVVVRDGRNQDVYGEVWQFRVKPFPLLPILFSRRLETNGNFAIFSGNENGDILQLTDDSESRILPRRSPNGDRIAFVQFVGSLSSFHLFTMANDGSDVQQITAEAPVFAYNIEDLAYTWTPNGDGFVYPGPGGNLYQISSDGSGLEEFASPPPNRIIEAVDWSRQNDRVIVRTISQDQQLNEIYLLNPATNQFTLLDDGPGKLGNPAFSFSGVEILYSLDFNPQPNDIGRRWDSRILIVNWPIGGAPESPGNISVNKPDGTNDINPRFVPNEAFVIATNVDNDEIINPEKVPSVVVIEINLNTLTPARNIFFNNGTMADWK